ncbi:MAG: hypothetical protein ABW221_09925 [Vicinamibacteria bacterium]
MKRRGPRRTALVLRSDELGLPSTGEPRLFLGRLTNDALRGELEAAGIPGFLESRGFPAVQVETDLADGEHRLRIAAGDGALLVELRLAEMVTPLPEGLRAAGPPTLHVLAILWAALQNPRASFTADRPRLPGQDHPGLGVGRRLYDLLRGWAGALGKDALLNVPEHYHNALFYAAPFRFLEPAEQGRFEALRRDLADLRVADASFAIEQGRVRDESGRTFAWDPGAMVAPVSGTLDAVLLAAPYREAVAAARDAARFRVT